MVKERMDLLELLRKGGMDGDVDFLREALRVLVEGIMDAEVSSRTGAGYGERSPERVTQRNGYRSRAWDTRVGTMDLHIPKLREGSYFPSLLEPRRRSERALLAVIQQAYVEGVSTRRVDDLVKALGCEGISKSQMLKNGELRTSSEWAISTRSTRGRSNQRQIMVDGQRAQSVVKVRPEVLVVSDVLELVYE